MRKPKLAVIPNDPLMVYERNGFSEKERNEYFNPNNEFDVRIFSVNYYLPSFINEKGLKKYEEYAGFKVHNIKNNLSNLEEALNEFNPELIRGYSNGTKLAIETGKLRNIPSFSSVHNLFPSEEIVGIDRLFVVSNEVKKKCLEKGIEEDKLRILPDRVNREIFYNRRETEEVKRINEKYNHKYKIISAGRLNWQKNLKNLFEASNLVKKVLGDLKHIHIGSYGDQKKELLKIYEKMDHLTILDNLDQESLSAYFSWADLFTMFSISEGFGLVYVEALSSGTPAITSNIYPMKDYILPGLNGELADPNYPEKIAKKIISTLTDREKLRILSANSRESVKQFDSKVLQKREAGLYKELL